MTKIARKILLVFCSFVFVLCLGATAVLGLNTRKTIGAKAAEPTVTFTGFGSRNNVEFGNGIQYPTVDIAFSGKFTETNGIDNGTVKDGPEGIRDNIYYTEGGTKKDFEFIWANRSDCGANVLMLANTEAIADGAVLTIVEGTAIGGQVLPAVSLTLVDGDWTLPVPAKEPTVEFTGVHEKQNNDNFFWSTFNGTVKPGTYLVFDKAFTVAGGTTVTSDVGSGIYYTVSGSDEKHLIKEIAIGGAHVDTTQTTSTTNMLILLGADDEVIPEGAVLTVVEGTEVGGQVLPGVSLTLVGGNWVIKKAPTVAFTNVWEYQNNDNFVWAGVNGKTQPATYLVFDKAFSGTAGENVTATVGSGIYYTVSGSDEKHLITEIAIGGAHVDKDNTHTSTANMLILLGAENEVIPEGAVLTVVEGTEVGGQVLPAVTLYLNAEKKWQKDKPEPIVSGFTAVEGGSIRIDRENGGLRFETHLEKATYDSLVKLYGKENLKIGTYILPAEYLTLSGKSLRDYVTAYTADDGYYLDISTWNTEKNDFGFANSDKDGNILDGGSFYKYYGTIAKVKDKNYLENFIGVGYIRITDKDGAEYLYLTHDGSWSRNVYEIAKAAYQDTKNLTDDKMYGVTPYFNKVVDVTTDESENGFAYAIDEVLKARSYSYTKPTDYTVTVDKDNGLITIESNSSAVYNVMINGEKAGVIEANGTAYADYYAVTPELFATAEETSALNYAFGEPTQELWGQGGYNGWTSDFGTPDMNQGSTAEAVAKVNAAYGGNSVRIWSQTSDLCWPDSHENVVLNEQPLAALKKVIADMKAQGITNISWQTGVVNTRATKNYYNSTDKAWYTTWEVLSGASGGAYPGLVTLPDDKNGTVSGLTYAQFLQLQKDYFKLVIQEIGADITVIEILNEVEAAHGLFRTYYENGKVAKSGSMPSIDVVAQIAMDICKVATDAVAESNHKNLKVMMPALMTVDGRTDDGQFRYDSIEFFKAEYKYIEDSGTGDADDYFQVANIHPYVMLSKTTSSSNYLYGDNKDLQTPAEIAKRWKDYVEGLRKIMVDNGDAEKPMWITEMGIADYNGDCVEDINTNGWSDYRNNTLLRQAQVYQATLDVIKELPYIDTVIFFRLGDYQHTLETKHSFATCGEATYGMITKDGQLKDIGKYLYAMLNGAEIFTDSDYDELIALDKIVMPEGKDSIANFETYVESAYSVKQSD